MFSSKVAVSSPTTRQMVHTKSMAHPAKHRGVPTRTLGSVRKSTSSIDTVPKFPPLTSPNALERSYQSIGISGNAMQVPPPRETLDTPDRPEPEDRQTFTKPTGSSGSPRKASHSSKSTDSLAVSDKSDAVKNKELKDAMSREGKLKQTIVQLQKVIDDLTMQVKDKEKVIDDLQKQFLRQEEKYKELYENEKVRHEETKGTLSSTKQELDTARSSILDMEKRHDRDMSELRTLMEVKLKDLREEKEKEIAIKEEKLNKLKKQMAEALKGNSWERQQQLDELTKELTRVQDEADTLRLKLKTLQKAKGTSAGGVCSNCNSTRSQLSASQRTVRQRDDTIRELQQLCGKFEKQLGQQDAVVRQLANKNGHRTGALLPPK